MLKTYNQLKPISGKALHEAEACQDQLEFYIQKYGFFDEIQDFYNFIEYAKRESGWISFLIQENFIEKIKEKETYKYGDIFRVKYIINNDTTFGLLAQTSGGKIAMISLISGNRYRDGIIVQNSAHITKRELNRIIGDGRWKHLPEAEITIIHEGDI